ncbi:MAG TPA: 30S ribosomal protein S18 [Brevefilum fermentans]|jgi:small subunit ribosomal protein S18|uniref:30S ribosomal protein S18 n=1 Tax=Candidatus Brevifilum fermentans TaxID=1986204 RepID=UPI000B41D5EB|nr:30S ribosomal protein S18 [Brevefilum fermentans]MDI9566504.1 30S ribosomal protein S18 [Chloroflexota bacterium]HQA28914.1 30S ribosomal protein S18 [Brevefilum fermentans]
MTNLQSSRYYSRSKVCQFCTNVETEINYKNTELLKHYIDETGKIRPRRQTGVCAKHQRALAKAIKNARHIALLPFVNE